MTLITTMKTTTLKRQALWLLCLTTVASGCDSQIPTERSLTSLRLSLRNPTEAELGSPANPVTPTQMTFDVDTLDEKGQPFSFDGNLYGYVIAGGSRLWLVDPCTNPNPTSDPTLLKTLSMRGGKVLSAQLPLNLPAIFGRVALNLEETKSRALGSTPAIYFPNPTITKLMKPLDITAPNASYCSPYLSRQVTVDRTETSAGKLIVSSIFQNGLAVSDTSAPDYGSMYIFTFSQPSKDLQIGTVLERMSGSIAKFNGMTQLANPILKATGEFRSDWVPVPIELDKSRMPTGGPTSANNQWLTKRIASPVRVSGIVCEVGSDKNRADNWQKYNTVVINQLDLDPESEAGCGGVNLSYNKDMGTRFNVQLPGKGFGGFDPAQHAGQEATFVGMLQNAASKSGKTLFWTVVVRKTPDVCLKPKAECP